MSNVGIFLIPSLFCRQYKNGLTKYFLLTYRRCVTLILGMSILIYRFNFPCVCSKTLELAQPTCE